MNTKNSINDSLEVIRRALEDEKNDFLKVEYTFGFIKINPDELRINLHHSSLPYNE